MVHPTKVGAVTFGLGSGPAGALPCGACVPVCPVEAIYAEEDMPDKWAKYKETNAKFFQ